VQISVTVVVVYLCEGLVSGVVCVNPKFAGVTSKFRIVAVLKAVYHIECVKVKGKVQPRIGHEDPEGE
jgi:hypothetical protein